jgi:hypothetical protein
LEKPEWWEWELAFTEHVERRMEEREFAEVELREMLEEALELRPGRQSGRWEVRTRHGGRAWLVVVEPDEEEELLFVVTAFPTRE